MGILTNKLSSLGAARDLTDSNVNKVIALKPAIVSVTTLNHDSVGNINITGSAATQEDILAYAQELRDSGLFTTVVASISYSSSINELGEQLISYKYAFQMQ